MENQLVSAKHYEHHIIRHFGQIKKSKAQFKNNCYCDEQYIIG